MKFLMAVLFFVYFSSPSIAGGHGCSEPARPACMEGYQYRSNRVDVRDCVLKIGTYFQAVASWAICLDLQLTTAKSMLNDISDQEDCLMADRQQCKLSYRLWTAPVQPDD